ncbi:hypothetical protein BKE38_19325 [Pseudoroseomonas deserti]|uniref:diguanylate cyclase n=2 Tax=Teichococcus deserti TaxID=1817963 RepID=A0A1V2GYI4_9PROT|nr:hypothetical protein BKE38_19325 [Pseudoroseomonas deserti]
MEREAGSPARFGRRLNLLALAIALGVMGVTGASLWQSRQDAWDSAEIGARNVIAALGRDIGGNIRLVEAAMEGVADGLALPGIWAYPPDVRYLILFDRSARSPYLHSVMVFDTEGESIADSDGVLVRPLNVADRDYFRVHRDGPDAGLYLSEPFANRLHGGITSIAVSRRLDGPGGEFRGIVAATLSLPAVQQRLAGIALPADSSLNLFALDGSILVRQPPLAGGQRLSLAGAPTFERVKAEGEGVFTGPSAIDGGQKLYAFTRPAGLPLILNTAIPTREIMQPWLRKAAIMAALTVLLCGAVVVLTFLFQRELTRRSRLEAALEALAVTDALTGLANRRAMDRALEREWRAARRNGRPISFMMIDLDWFKQFNDYYGHTEGDQALRAVARLLLETARRPRDQAARYGGEEFCLLMPETDAAGARRVAQTLHAAVARRAMPHAGSPGGTLSLSIGLATADPRQQEPGPGDALQLVEAADRALYRAKAAGRDRIEARQVA